LNVSNDMIFLFSWLTKKPRSFPGLVNAVGTRNLPGTACNGVTLAARQKMVKQNTAFLLLSLLKIQRTLRLFHSPHRYAVGIDHGGLQTGMPQ